MSAAENPPGSGAETGYDPAAALYDLEYPECGGDELQFWSRLARDAGTRVLELASGTGRVAIALAELGFQVTGLDASAQMLARAQRKRAGKPAATAERLHFLLADMRDYALHTGFDLVFAAFNAYLLLPDRAARDACLRTATRHLRAGGTLAVDVFAANELDRTPDHEQVEFLDPDPESGRRVTRERFYTHDESHDRGISTLIYRLYGDDGSVEERRLVYGLALLDREAVVNEFEAAGLAVTGVYGNYQCDAWRPQAAHLLVVGRKAPR